MKKERQSVYARHTQMLAAIKERGEMKVEELAELFQVSLMTVRRDLQYLEEKGLLRRYFGGATVDTGSVAKNLAAPNDEVALYRKLIARYAARLLEDGDAILINGSTTALSVLDYAGENRLQVFTNNGLAVAGSYPENIAITLSGGTLRGNSHIMTGDCTVRNLLTVQADKALMGCTGISSAGEILCGIPTELAVNELMISHSREYFILADHTKIGRTNTYASFSLEKKGTIITDEKASARVVERLREIGMRVIQVKRGREEA